MYTSYTDIRIMTRKPTLERWATRLGANLPADSTVKQLEEGIEEAIADLTEPPPTLGEALSNNWAVLRAEVPAAVKEIANNLLS